MAHPLHDTIVAPITGAQRAAVAIVRVSGPQAWEIASKLFAPFPESPTPRHAYFGRFAHGDDGLLLLFSEGHSFTGEQTAEFNIHGSPGSVRELVGACLASGARLAEAGEFTYRAFMNGRIDLTAAEGIRETVDAETSRQLRQALLMREGKLREEVSAIRDQVFGVLAMVEACVDFSEEIGDLDHEEASRQIAESLAATQRLIGTETRGKLVRDGLSVAIVGRPNAGKSSLLNTILKSDRAIVTPIAGTTRDTVEEWAEVRGQMVRFMDTAGLRETGDVVERLGVERALQAAQGADVIWYVYDAAAGWAPEDSAEVEKLGREVLVLANKSDLARVIPAEHQPISALLGTGISELLEKLVRDFDEVVAPAINSRHRPLLEETKRALEATMETFSQGLPDDLASVHLREAVMKLGEITGETANEDMVTRIFRDFCIGK